ncbi:MAG: radical SAM protein [Nitrospirae bacterium]|nr:radical SAM protein [Nitrospirota bacterium]
MHDKVNNKEEIFVIPKESDKYILYAPLRGSSALVNAATVSVVARYLQDKKEGFDGKDLEILNTLTDQGMLGDPVPRPPLFPDNYVFYPHEVTLFPTSRCNLRCRYCYAEAGKKSVDMPLEIAQAAIDVVATNGGLLGSKSFVVGFHGGGEPTVAWHIITGSIDYGLKKSQESGLDVEFHMATNGMLTDMQRKYIVEHFTTVNVSLDGPDYIQNHNRPKVNGGDSFSEVYESLLYFDQNGFHYGIHTTITDYTVARMEEIVSWLAGRFNLKYLQIEPAWFCGRCISSGEKSPDEDAFVENFLKVRVIAREKGINLFYSGARINVLTSKFCAAPGDGFNVLPEGVVTSCYEVTDMDDPRANIFHYGRYNHNSNTFDFDMKRMKELSKLSVENLPFCRDCFCKWHCSGDCLAKAVDSNNAFCHQGSFRCKLNRRLTLAQIEEQLLGGDYGRQT